MLRDVQPADLPTLFAFENDPTWCAMAMVKSRSEDEFRAAWANIFDGWESGTTDVIQKVILVDGELCGTIGCHRLNSRHVVGYGLGKAYWGRRIASRALGLLLAEVPIRPLHATTAATNAASIRVLTKHGFAIEKTRIAPETRRCLAREEMILVLA